jgi:hypothetical protein
MAKRKASNNLNSGKAGKAGCDCFLCRMSKRRKEMNKERDIIKKTYEKLSLVDKNAYHQIIDRARTSYIFIAALPVYFLFYLGLFGLVLLFAFQINILEELKILAMLFLDMIFIFFLLWVVLAVSNTIEVNRLKKELLLGVKK